MGIKPIVLMVGETIFLAVVVLLLLRWSNRRVVRKTRGSMLSRGMKHTLRFALLACAVFLICTPAAAQPWPTKPVRIIAAGTAGGTADIVARLLADALAKELRQPVIVEPKPGAAGAIAVTDLLQAPRDGYTVLVGVNSLVSEIPHIVKLASTWARRSGRWPNWLIAAW